MKEADTVRNQGTIDAFERYRELIPDFEAFLEALSKPPATSIRVNTLKIGVEPFRALMAKRGFRLEPIPGVEEAFLLHDVEAPGSTLEYFLGYYHVQGLTSMLPPRILDPRPGETILDLCAAPGGKTIHLAQLMRGKGLIVANDAKVDRLGILRSHIDRLGATSILTCMYQGQSFPTKIPFHRVLLDPPCSAEGTHRKSGTPLTEEPKVILRLSRLQRMLLRRALSCLLPGGILVYSTCTYAPEENEMVLDEVLEEGSVEVLDISVPFPHSPGLTSWQGNTLHPDLKKAIRIYPHQVNAGGFFIARLRKRS